MPSKNSVAPLNTDKPTILPQGEKTVSASNDAKEKPSRRNTVLIGGHFAPEVKKQLKLMAVEEDTTNQQLIGEALNLLFVKKGRKAISV